LAIRITKSFEDILQQKIAAVAALGVTITASVLETNSTWPFVDIKNFQERSASARSLSGALALQMLPVVTNETRAGWEEFISRHTGWISGAFEYQTKNGIGQIQGETSASESIVFLMISTYDPTGTLIVEQGVRARIEHKKSLCDRRLYASSSLISPSSAAGTILSFMAILSGISSAGQPL